MKLYQKLGLFFLAAFAAAALSVPGEAAGRDDPSPCDFKVYGLDAEKFFLYLTRDTPYTGWKLWPAGEPLRPAAPPHGPYRTTYVNPAAYDSLARGGKMAFGSLIVIENRDRDQKVRRIDVRIKLKGYNPEEGDWYWLSYALDGKVMAEGKAAACIGCHSRTKATDYLMHAPTR